MVDVFVLGGENPVFLKEELDKITHSFPEEDRAVYYGDELELEDFFTDLLTGSLFSAHRMLVVRNADKAKGEFEKQLLNYLKDPSASVCLVLEYQKIPTKILNSTAELGNKRAVVHNFKKAWAQDQKRYAHRRLDDKGVSCDASVIDLLVTFAGEDIEELAGMLDKLISYVGTEKKSIDEKDIQHVLERAQNASIFDLIDAIFNHDIARSLQSLQDLLHAGESYPAMTAMFYRATKIMWAVKTANNGQMPAGFAVSPYEWRKYQGFVSKNNLRFLSSCFECIATLEMESKTKPAIFAQTTFEKFLCSL